MPAGHFNQMRKGVQFAAHAISFVRKIFLLGFLFLLVATPKTAWAVDPVVELLEKTAIEAGATNEESSAAAAPQQDLIAGESQLAALRNALTNESKNLFGDPIIGKSHLLSKEDWLLLLVAAVAGVIAVKKVLPSLRGSISTIGLPMPVPVPAWAGAAEEQSFSDFAVSFRVGPTAPVYQPPNREALKAALPEPRKSSQEQTPERQSETKEEPKAASAKAIASEPAKLSESVADAPAAAAAQETPDSAAEEDAEVELALPADSPEQFFATVDEDYARLRKLLAQSGGDMDKASTEKNLKELLREMRSLKNKASLPELLPIWQMSAALEGLINQLVEKPANITASSLHTVNAGVQALQSISVSGLKPDLVSEPPVRVLAVDDDAICRHAVSFALKKALNPPELLSNPEAALARAEKELFDVILLDVEMPGMDGYELCSRIHKTEVNKDTPVVFVTRHADFEARAKSTLAGGDDLIAKPFLIFEITVKTLTLLLQVRLRRAKATTEVPAEVVAATA